MSNHRSFPAADDARQPGSGQVRSDRVASFSECPGRYTTEGRCSRYDAIAAEEGPSGTEENTVNRPAVQPGILVHTHALGGRYYTNMGTRTGGKRSMENHQQLEKTDYTVAITQTISHNTDKLTNFAQAIMHSE